MISTRHILDGVTVTTSTRVEGKIRLSLDHQFFDLHQGHMTPDQARQVAHDLSQCADACEAFKAGAGGHVVASPQRAQQGTTRQGFLIVLAGAAVTWGFLGYAFWQHLGR